MISKLRELGIIIEWERVEEIAGGGSIGRPHIAQAMLEKGYIASIKEAFTKYISRNGLAYVERQKMSPAEAVELILRASGLPVLAHPLTIDDPEAVISELKASGLVGIEAYYNNFNSKEIDGLVKRQAVLDEPLLVQQVPEHRLGVAEEVLEVVALRVGLRVEDGIAGGDAEGHWHADGLPLVIGLPDLGLLGIVLGEFHVGHDGSPVGCGGLSGRRADRSLSYAVRLCGTE